MGNIIELDQRFHQWIPRPPDIKRLAEPSWILDLSKNLSENDFDLGAFDYLANSNFCVDSSNDMPLLDIGMRRSAGVLVIVALGPHGPSMVLTRRAMHLKTHSGEVSFPGGKIEEGESTLDAAIRECYEEIGIPASSLQVMGKIAELQTLSTSISMSAYLATSNVSLPAFGVNFDEVDAVFEVPLETLVAPGTYHRELWRRGNSEKVMHFFSLENDQIWGATAFIIVEVLKFLHTTLK